MSSVIPPQLHVHLRPMEAIYLDEVTPLQSFVRVVVMKMSAHWSM